MHDAGGITLDIKNRKHKDYNKYNLCMLTSVFKSFKYLETKTKKKLHKAEQRIMQEKGKGQPESRLAIHATLLEKWTCLLGQERINSNPEQGEN